MEVELEHGDHELDHLLRVVGEVLLELPCIANQHLTGRGLVLQSGSFDAEILLLS